MQPLKFVIVICALVLWSIGLSYQLGKDAGRDRGRREQAALTPAACREVENVLGRCVAHAGEAVEALRSCEARNAEALQIVTSSIYHSAGRKPQWPNVLDTGAAR